MRETKRLRNVTDPRAVLALEKLLARIQVMEMDRDELVEELLEIESLFCDVLITSRNGIRVLIHR